MKKSIKGILFLLAVLLVLLILLFLVRLITPREIDDISPGINCPEIEKYNPDIFYVIPDYSNNPISKNREWCDYILSLNKTVEMHGITHEYEEFSVKNISQEELNYGISEFEKCFNKSPEKFKAPQLEISYENRQLIKKNNLKMEGLFNQLTHKVYHCSDSDIISNRIIHIF